MNYYNTSIITVEQFSMNKVGEQMDMDELLFFLYMEEQEQRQKTEEQEDDGGEGQDD